MDWPRTLIDKEPVHVVGGEVEGIVGPSWLFVATAARRQGCIVLFLPCRLWLHGGRGQAYGEGVTLLEVTASPTASQDVQLKILVRWEQRRPYVGG